MKLLTCKKGHYFNAEKYNICPHCGGNAGLLYPKEFDDEEKFSDAFKSDTVQISSNSEENGQLLNVTLPSELGLFQIHTMLGEGRTSKVFRISPNVNYALKVVDITGQAAESAVDNEYRIARQLDDEKHFVVYYALYKQDGKAYIVQPELRNLLGYISEGYSYLELIFKILKDIAEAIVIMHKKGIIHLDIKPTNIFVDKDGHGILGDFSTSCEIEMFKKKPFRGGTPKYFPPEVYKEAGYSGKEDMYSFGITMYYILSGGKYPYDFEESVTRSAESEYITSVNIPDGLQFIIEKATAYYPDDRYDSMQEICDLLRMMNPVSESHKTFQRPDYYEADTAYTCNLSSAKENRSVMRDNISDTVPLASYDDGNDIQSHRQELVEALRRNDTVVVKDDKSVDLYPKSTDEPDFIFSGVKLAGRQRAGIPFGKLASGTHFCRVCGANLAPDSKFCIMCGNRLDEQLEISKVHFSAMAPKTLIKGDYTMINIVMYQDAFRSVADELIKEAEVPVQEVKSGVVKVKEGARVKIILSSPDITIEDNIEEQEWVGEYLTFNFVVMLPEKYAKRQVLFMATVYIDDVIATRLKFIAKCWSLRQQKIKVTKEDVLSAFVSYASQDRNRVAMIVQGMQKARPDMDIFFDVESLRSGESWEDALWSEIDQRDTLFLCWSRNAKESKWVDAEWRYAYAHKGIEAIEPIPLEPPTSCPPPEELQKKHFNDRLLYVIRAESEGRANNSEDEEPNDT